MAGLPVIASRHGPQESARGCPWCQAPNRASLTSSLTFMRRAPMSIRAGLDVLKDGRPAAEISLNSAGVGSAIVDSNGQNSLTAGAGRVRFDRYTLDYQRGCLFAGDEEIALRPKTFEFLRYLAGNPGRVVSKDELLAAVWPNVVVSDDSVFQCVAELRRALQDQDQHLSKTVPRPGS